MSTIVYLARPIDQHDGSFELPDTEAAITNALIAAGYNVYRPAQAWRCAATDPRIESINRSALNRTDCVVALLPRGVPTIGTPMEIEYALGKGIPVVVVGAEGSVSLTGRPGVIMAGDRRDISALVDDAISSVPVKPLPGPSEVISVFGYPLKVTRVEEDIDPAYKGALLPARTYEDDAGLDLYATKQVTIPVGQFVDVPCGIAVELPYWAWGWITGRSSTLRKKGLIVQQGVIDPGYRGPLYTMVLNVAGSSRVVMPGDRVGQLIIMHNHTRSVTPQMVDALSDHPRGINGFGSSGS